MNIRVAELKDTIKIAEAHKSSIRFYCKNHYSESDIRAWTDIPVPGIYEKAIKEKIMIVAEENMDIKGLGILDIENKELSAIYIRPDSIGKGLGGILLNLLETTAINNEVNELFLSSTLNAFGFYKKNNYVPGQTTWHTLPNGINLKWIRMANKSM